MEACDEGKHDIDSTRTPHDARSPCETLRSQTRALTRALRRRLGVALPLPGPRVELAEQLVVSRLFKLSRSARLCDSAQAAQAQALGRGGRRRRRRVRVVPQSLGAVSGRALGRRRVRVCIRITVEGIRGCRGRVVVARVALELAPLGQQGCILHGQEGGRQQRAAAGTPPPPAAPAHLTRVTSALTLASSRAA